MVGTGSGNSPMRWSLGYRGAMVQEGVEVSSVGTRENVEEKKSPGDRAG